MASVVGPLVGAVVLVVGNEMIVMGENAWVGSSPNPKIVRPVVGGILAGVVLSVTATFMPATAELFSWLILVGVALVRIDKNTPSPLESILSWYNSTPPASGSLPQPKVG